MKHRAPTLSADQARCRPSEHCERQHECLRYKAELPALMAVLMDGMIERRDALGRLRDCAHFLPAPTEDAAP